MMGKNDAQKNKKTHLPQFLAVGLTTTGLELDF
jgi:hypothetical protein